ncbi:SDR family NAD(P)-dependent oxidoreductase [Pseudonocardia sp.]|uniref:SDR family NAD(P)-dependent oxidoreductase n=1 Tax=Pseudonocardia sp. TaxID=60912 RepID=UPI003D143FDE
MSPASSPGVAVVTGGARGFGHEIARRLVARGHDVIVTDVDVDALGPAAEAIGATGLVADARRVEDHRKVAAEAAGRGRLTVWVNNAGVARAGRSWEQPDADVELTVEVNLLGVVHGSRVAVDAMRGHGGHIVNIASMSGLGPVPGLSVYAATKAGVVNFTASLQGELDLAGVPVRVHALCPHAADTALVRGARDSADAAILFSQRALLTPDAVADAAVGLLDGNRIVRSLPVHWAALSRIGATMPTTGLRVLAALRERGEKRRASA